MSIPHFDGVTYEPVLDYQRMASQLGRVWRFMADGMWHTVEEAERACGGTAASVTARFRDFRKAKFGGYRIYSRRRGPARLGIWEYRMGLPSDPPDDTDQMGLW